MAFFADLTDACGDAPSEICELVFDLTDSQRASGVADWLAGPPLRIVIILVGWWVISRVARRWVDRVVSRFAAENLAAEKAAEARRGMFSPLEDRANERLEEFKNRSERSRQRAATMGTVLRSTITLLIGVVAVLLILGELEIDLAPLLAGAGIAGIAFGFGAQSLVKDFLSGMFIVFEDQYGVGDNVDLGEASGQVERVSLRTTRIRDVEGTLWVVPNGEIRRVANHSQLWARTVLDIEVDYSTDIDAAIEVIQQTAIALWEDQAEATTILESPEVWGVQSLAESAVVIRLAVKTEPSEQWTTARELRRRIKIAFEQSGIDIPFPQQVVHLRTADTPG
ncbi:MAG: mechanosensitive ion channel family protein [Acidimicrobiia bacterium]|nr:mechanosensitive ion channel family protein [Acidimicrobiia bacterium]